MKKTILAIFALFSSVAAYAGPWDYNYAQYDQFGISPIPRLVVLPSGGASGIFIHNSSINLPALATVDTSLIISSGGVISVNAANFATTAALSGKFDAPVGTTSQYLRGDGSLATFPTIPASQIQSDWTQSNSGLMDFIKNKPTLATVATTGSYTDITGKPDLSVYALNASLANYATTAALGSGLAAKFNTPTGTTAQYVRGDGTVAAFPSIPPATTLTTTGNGAATYNSGTGALNIPTPSAASPFNFSQPTARTLSVSTSYQALDNTKAAVIYPSYACQNATQVLASSACTIQVRMGTGTLTCSTGTVYYTQSLSVSLGVLLTQNSTNPVPIFLPVGASLILCPTSGTFTVTTSEQSAG